MGQIGITLATLACVLVGVWQMVQLPVPASLTVPLHPAHRHHAGLPTSAVRGAVAPVDCARVACLALTFDDGPSATVTPQVLDILDRHHVHATFYVVGSRVAGNEALLRRMHAAGHEIGNHTWSHADLTTLSPEQVREQIANTQAAVAAAGVPLPTTFRPPYGAVNGVVRSNVQLTIVRWNVDPEDWDTKQAKDIVPKVESTAKPGGVVEMHDIHQQTADSLDQLLNDLTPRYKLVTVSELFSLPPGQRGEFFGR
jgi:peptidoglycan/xylan/chitin deacetylase (PgdA/CDA1 family)